MKWTSAGRVLASCAMAIPLTLIAGMPAGQAKNGDTHIIGEGVEQTIDCNNATLVVNGTANTVNALGTCWAVTVMGSGNTVVANTVINDITVYGYDETVVYRGGDPVVWDRGRELGMTNRINRAGA